ncbi:beta-1,3-glucan-binding protein-like [Ctenocephalides felis]|uniref:beta-1,3-glucan-binding protein-like n=1 Tax=Ctenocephalides felis TaxID=7515 RepID=UPI000E6E1DB1|nr:beta-1,3-glucan-binding protein-like [Ctenocephalides felis]
MAIQASVNEPVTPLTPGEYSGEVTRSLNGRWTFENKNARLRPGDVLHYWMFVQHERLGYRRDDEKVTIIDLSSRSQNYDTNPTNTNNNNQNCEPSLTTVKGIANVCKGQLIFEDNFVTKKLDDQKWHQDCHIPSYEEDNEYVSYQARPENLIINNGRLSIWPTILKDNDYIQTGELNMTEICGCRGTKLGECYGKAMTFNILQPVVSASVRSKFSFRYGKVQIRAKLPKGNWLYPLLNLEPLDYEYGPGYRSGKIRIAFARGNDMLMNPNNGYDFGSKEMNAGLLLGQFKPPRNHSTRTYQEQNGGHWTSAFHTYEVVWTPSNLQVSVDGINFAVISPPPGGFKSVQDTSVPNFRRWDGDEMAPFDKQMVIRMALACGGVTDFPDNTVSGGNIGPPRPKPWRNLEPKAMLSFWQDILAWESTWKPDGASLQVEFVKVWAL